MENPLKGFHVASVQIECSIIPITGNVRAEFMEDGSLVLHNLDTQERSCIPMDLLKGITFETGDALALRLKAERSEKATSMIKHQTS